MAVLGELGRHPVMDIAKSLSIKYWLRLESGTENMILNKAYEESSNNRSEWVQEIQSLLCENGYGDIWQNPKLANKDSFHKVFRE